jgi:hypothetical protein
MRGTILPGQIGEPTERRTAATEPPNMIAVEKMARVPFVARLRPRS